MIRVVHLSKSVFPKDHWTTVLISKNFIGLINLSMWPACLVEISAGTFQMFTYKYHSVFLIIVSGLSHYKPPSTVELVVLEPFLSICLMKRLLSQVYL